MNRRLLSLGGLAVGLGLIALSDHLGWLWLGLLLVGGVAARFGAAGPPLSGSRAESLPEDDAAPGAGEPPAWPSEETRETAGAHRQRLVGLLLVLGGFLLLGGETGRWSLGEIRSAATASRAGERGTTKIAALRPSRTLPAAVLVTVGLLALGRLPPFPGGSGAPSSPPGTPSAAPSPLAPDHPGTIEFVSRLAVTAALWRVAARTVVLVEPRTETLLASLAMLGWMMVILRLVGDTGDDAAGNEHSRDLVGRPLVDWTSVVWLTAVAVGSWEGGHPDAALTGQSVLPSAATALILCALGDLLAWGVLRLIDGEAPSLSRGAAVLRRIGAAAWLGFPLGPGFWGRMWLLAACFSCTHTAPLTGVPEFHTGFQLLALALLVGWLTGTIVGVGELGSDPPVGGVRTEPPRPLPPLFTTRPGSRPPGGSFLSPRWRSRVAFAVVLLLASLGLYPRPLLAWLCAWQGAL